MTQILCAPVDLIGAWRLERVVHDRRSGQRHLVAGSTSLEMLRPGLIAWSERGTMTSPFGTTPVTRRLDIARDDRGEWVVFFADGRPFHAWTPSVSVAHHCGRDLYSGRIEVSGDQSAAPQRWRMTWEALGPAKDYRIESVMTRTGGEIAAETTV